MTLPELLEDAAKTHAARTALIFQEKRWTYKEVHEKVLSLAAGLSAQGVRAGDRVALFAKNCPEFIFSVFALGRIAAAAVPINFMVKAEEAAFILNDIAAKHLITQSPLQDTVKETQKIYPGLKNIWVVGQNFDALYAAAAETVPACKTDDVMMILYTSGTAGHPKGAMLTHGNLTSNALSSAEALEINKDDRFLVILPLFHSFAWTANILVPFCRGALVVLVEAIRPPKPWLKLMAEHKVTCFSAVPAIYAVLADQAKGFAKWVIRWFFFRNVRLCISGAAPLTRATLDRFEANIGIPIMEGYGLTETSPVTNSNTPKARRAGSVGKAIPGVKIKIIGADGQSLPVDEEGEICVQGPNVMKGYYNLPKETAEAFTKDGWFRTGDVGAQDADGFLYIRDRIKDMIIVKGLKVFSAQVEDILLEHPAVLEAAVIGIPDDTGDETVKAFVVLKPGALAGKQELLDFCKEKFPPYKRPRDVEVRKELPKNSLQKVLKRQLRAESMKGPG